jgi:hypothetical protein
VDFCGFFTTNCIAMNGGIYVLLLYYNKLMKIAQMNQRDTNVHTE